MTEGATDSAQARIAFRFWQLTGCSIIDAADRYEVEPEDIMAVYKKTRPLRYFLMVAKVNFIIRVAFVTVAARRFRERFCP